jgi:transcriptional regulator with XRE-family HTH domain
MGTRFRELREKRGLTAREISEALDISEASILAYERGDKKDDR